MEQYGKWYVTPNHFNRVFVNEKEKLLPDIQFEENIKKRVKEINLETKKKIESRRKQASITTQIEEIDFDQQKSIPYDDEIIIDMEKISTQMLETKNPPKNV